jgi:chemotaxis protein methyltransferase CheR
MTMHHRRPAGAREPEPLCDLTFARIRDLVEARCGLDFGDSRRASLHAAVHARMRQLGLSEPGKYCERLCASAADEEFRSLVNLVTINETCFFRDPAQFRMLRSHILPALLAERGADGRRRLRICSAGCSSGEEPYSVAMLIQDMDLAGSHPDWTIDIVGVDVNTEMLEAAERGVYSARAVRNVEGESLGRYFVPQGRHFQLQDGVKRAVTFEHGSVTEEPAFRSNRYDLILCKNVAIYFRPEVTRRLVRRLHAALNEGGYLLLGHSESLWQMEEGFTLVEHDGVFCYRKPLASSSERAVRSSVQSGLPVADRCADKPAGEYERCLELFRAGDWGQAETALQALTASSPTFVSARLLLAGIHSHFGRFAEAQDQAEQVLGLDDLEPKAHLLLGMIAARAGRQDEAIDALRRALYLDDSLALAYFWLGNLYRDRGDFESASDEHAQAVRRHARHQLDFTEEFAADLRPAQIVNACRQSVRRLGSGR